MSLSCVAYRGARERVIPSDGVSGCFFSAGPLRDKHAMPDLDPATIDTLLQEGARRRGIKVNAYRDLVQAKADIAGIRFPTALLGITAFEKMSPGERKAWFEQLATFERQAARYGMSVARFVRIMLGRDDGKLPPGTD